MSSAIHRFFGITVPGSSEAAKPESRLSVEQIRNRLLGLVADCRDQRTQRLIYKINVSSTAADLWLLRSDVHQCIAQAHSQGEAVTRINSLLHAFEGWLPKNQLVKI